MIKNYFTDETQIIKIEVDEILKYDKTREEQLQQLAEKISTETGVPLYCISANQHSCRVSNWHQLQNGYYYFKHLENEHAFFNELLGEIISYYFDLDTAHYEVANLKVRSTGEEQYGVVSKNFCNPKYTYHTLSHYMCECDQFSFYSSDLSIIDKLEVLCQTEDEFRLLQDDFKKMIIRNFYNAQSDGDGRNIILKTTPSGIRLAPLFDYSDAYVGINNLHRYVWDIGELNVEDRKTQELFRNDIAFQKLLHKLMDANMDEFIADIENSHKIIVPKKQAEHYKKYDKKIKQLVLENKLIK